MQNEQTFTPADEFTALWDNDNELILIDEPSSEFLMQCLSELKRCLEDGFPSDEHPTSEAIQDAIDQLYEEHKKFAAARYERHVYPEPEEPPDVDEPSYSDAVDDQDGASDLRPLVPHDSQ